MLIEDLPPTGLDTDLPVSSANPPLALTSTPDAVEPLVPTSLALEAPSHTESEPPAPASVQKVSKTQDADVVVYLYVDVQPLAKEVRAHGRKRKSVKQDPIRCGPAPITVSGITWQSLGSPFLRHSHVLHLIQR